MIHRKSRNTREKRLKNYCNPVRHGRVTHAIDIYLRRGYIKS